MKHTIRGALVAIALLALAGPALAESLYQAKEFRPLTADRKAYKVGDLLTVQVYENATATTSADTATRRRNNVSAVVGHGMGPTAQLGVAVGGDFDGGGRTERTNRFLTTLTVAVTEVLPNGDLRVQGEQLLTLNQEQQRVLLQGRVRPQDINESNSVLSNRLADARISFAGTGDLSERQRPSWWRRLVDALGL